MSEITACGGPQTSPSLYSNLALGSSDIRLLTIKSSQNDAAGAIVCTLEVASLGDETHPYNALSYTWESPSVEEPDRPAALITCNGVSIPITGNLHAALLRIRSNAELSGAKFWVDAICINQDDDRERSSQVALMSKIYTSAMLVVVWLGEEDGFTGSALELMDQFAAEVDRYEDKLMPHHVRNLRESAARQNHPASTTSAPALGDPATWTAVRKLFRRNYFSRAWIIQEVILAREILVLCGSHVTLWAVVQAVSYFLTTTSLATYFTTASLREPVPGPSYHHIPARLEAIKNWMRRQRGGYANVLTHALVRGRHFRATDPRDKVYALLGLLGAAGGEEEASGKERLRPVYGARSVKAVYVAAAVQILEDSEDLMLLYSVEGEGFQYSALPSWVPDWRCAETVGLGITGYHRFDAAPGRARSLVIRESERVLELKGLKCGEIELSGETKQEIAAGKPFPRSMAILQDSIARAKERGGGEEDGIDAAWRSLITNTNGNQHQCPADSSYAGAFAHWISEKLSALPTPENDTYGHADMAALFRRLKTDAPAAPEAEDFDTTFSYAMRLRLFSTREGLIGVGSECLEAGDEVWLVPGSRVPLIFRNVGSGLHRLVGGAYVHGLMHGEAFRGFNDDDLDWKTLLVA
ncbi:hypothetical protein CSOJ01_02153 [Colletotrichum sojae]|uniref:Heterokaryon incompatibility domain-containing protein n=1 Tax=Colletotrichum sojae TaxID=2175907 RepID=A0A8H6JSF2_9PEZI|nr:hypothetical protein CSOJ01_02153 [Colletotrichum sojae]